MTTHRAPIKPSMVPIWPRWRVSTAVHTMTTGTSCDPKLCENAGPGVRLVVQGEIHAQRRLRHGYREPLQRCADGLRRVLPRLRLLCIEAAALGAFRVR